MSRRPPQSDRASTSSGTGRHRPIAPRVVNIVHDDENWRQRVHAEHIASSHWKGSWGFLEHSRTDDQHDRDKMLSHAKLSATLSEIGPCYPFLLNTYRQHSQRQSSKSESVIGLPSIHDSQSRRVEESKDSQAQIVPPLYIDASLAISMQPRMRQDVGYSMHTHGLNPNAKYRHPQTASHAYGWRESRPLEFFGVKQHAKRGLNL